MVRRGERRSVAIPVMVGLMVTIAAGCGSDDEPAATGQPTDPPAESTTDAPSDAPPDVLTEADDGAHVVLEPGDELPVRLSSDWVWDLPQVTAGAIEVVPVDYALDPGFTEWMVETREVGTSEVSIAGEPNCGDDAACPARIVVFRFEVAG